METTCKFSSFLFARESPGRVALQLNRSLCGEVAPCHTREQIRPLIFIDNNSRRVTADTRADTRRPQTDVNPRACQQDRHVLAMHAIVPQRVVKAAQRDFYS